jgi:hypothetical protein
VDGHVTEWPQDACVNLATAQYVRLTRDSTGDADISARVCLAWTLGALHVSATVTDDTHRNTQTGAGTWNGDGLQVALDTDGDRTPGAYDNDGDYEYGLALAAGASVTWRWVAPPGATNGAAGAVTRGGVTTTYELSVPWADLTNLSGRNGEAMGLSFLVNDDDTDGREGFVQWTDGMGRGKDPSLFGTAVLVGGPGPVDAGVGGRDAGVPSPAGLASPYGINIHIPQGTSLTTQVDKVRAAGIAWVRIDVNWVEVQPQRNQFSWGRVDNVVAAATARGLHVYATLAYAPRWANGNQDIQHPATDSADWKRFCRLAAERYDGQHGHSAVTHFGMWNEPDLSQFFSGTAQDYVQRVLIPCAAGVREGNPAAKVLGPDLAGDGDFLEEVLQSAGSTLDVITLHNYGSSADDIMDKFDGWRWFWEDPNLRDVIQGAGLLHVVPVWLTETGRPTHASWSCWFRDTASEAEQAQVYTDLLDQVAQRDWMDKVFFYELVDADLTIACQWGILYGDLREKEAYRAYASYITAHPVP